ncbi:MAG TPA: valine--tRNA ligase [Bryobacteraceae bacterium]|nr:valine--tRNA ligase [Bryobacteraceae bacterium]
MQLEKVYEPQRFEPHWAQWWIDAGIFHADVKSDAPVFSLVIPPPNVTGSLHIGHMLEHSLIDCTVRWHRMRGDNTLWLPGTDHAGISTEMMVVRQLASEGTSRNEIGREKFIERVWKWKEQYGGTIIRQMIRMGTSCDWSRERFTMDSGLSRAVREVFVRLWEKGLIYRGEYMVNWCPRCQTVLSDLEVKHEETAGHLWHIRYPVVGTDRYLVVATTRPETMLGDTAVAINPRDARYFELHGKTVMLPLMDREIPIILDELADPKFGTGAVKVTPAHDPNDFEAGKRHDLPKIKVIDENARMTAEAGRYAGLDRFEARKQVVADLEQRGLIEKIEDYTLSVGRCERTKDIVEPLISTQWFVKTKPLAEKAIEVVESGKIGFIPENWTKVYYEWMYNIRDWCISRQLWWGHRIPAWHCQDCSKINVAREEPRNCCQCGSARLVQDTDVLDTWFSSQLWPFSTLGWPDDTEDLRKFYPTSLLITGFDILFFWVARMIMAGMEFMGEVPFHQVYIHGLVRDAERQKMSKTKGNTIDPLVVTEKYGTDAVRLALLMGAAPGTDIVLSEERMESTRAFANKIWNAARLIFMNMERSGVQPWVPEDLQAYRPEGDEGHVRDEDRWIFSRLSEVAEFVNLAIGQFRYHEVAQELWHFFWHEFCDWYLEIKKAQLKPESGMTADWRNLLAAFEAALRLLHPVMPFLTEEIWQRLAPATQARPKSIALASYPKQSDAWKTSPGQLKIRYLQNIMSSARTLRTEMKLDPKVKLTGVLYSQRPELHDAAKYYEGIIQTGTNVTLDPSYDPAPQSGAVISWPEGDIELNVPQSNLAEQRKRLEKEREQLEKNIANSTRQLGDETFLSRAPAHVVESIKTKLVDYETQLAKVRKALNGSSS